MDPNKNLLDQEELLTEIAEYRVANDLNHPACVNAQRDLIERRQELTDWLARGGFAPDWTRAPHARVHYGYCAVCCYYGCHDTRHKVAK